MFSNDRDLFRRDDRSLLRFVSKHYHGNFTSATDSNYSCHAVRNTWISSKDVVGTDSSADWINNNCSESLTYNITTPIYGVSQSINAELLIVSVITALFFYNIYDATDIGRRVNAGIGWSSALIIGGLCGLLNAKVIAALRVLLG